MPVGEQLTMAELNQIVTNQAVSYRDLAQEAINVNAEINGAGNGLAVLEAMGYSANANPANPGGVSDAQWMQTVIGYLFTQGQIFNGQATQPDQFDFANALAPVYANLIS